MFNFEKTTFKVKPIAITETIKNQALMNLSAFILVKMKNKKIAKAKAIIKLVSPETGAGSVSGGSIP